MVENFITMKEHPDYEISKSGNIRKRGYMKTYDDGTSIYVSPVDIKPSLNSGQLIITIDKKQYSVDRLVASQFIDNPEHYMIVDFIDGNKMNVDVSNLKWVPHVSGIKNLIEESIDKYGTAPGTKIKCLQDGRIFRSIKAAANYYDIKYPTFHYNFIRNKEIDGKTFEYTSEEPNVTIIDE